MSKEVFAYIIFGEQGFEDILSQRGICIDKNSMIKVKKDTELGKMIFKEGIKQLNPYKEA